MQIKAVMMMMIAKIMINDNNDDGDCDKIDDDLLLVQLSFDQRRPARRWRWFGQYHNIMS